MISLVRAADATIVKVDGVPIGRVHHWPLPDSRGRWVAWLSEGTLGLSPFEIETYIGRYPTELDAVRILVARAWERHIPD